MNIMNSVTEHINKIPVGKPFTIASLRRLGKAENIRKIVSRLVSNGAIERVSRGVFVRPEHLPGFGKTLPSAKEVMHAIAESTGETLTTHGAEAARRFQLSTQIPLQLVLYTTGRTRLVKVHNRVVRLEHISQRKLVKPGTAIGDAILALWYLGKKHVTTDTIKKIHQQLKPAAFNSFIENAEHMPAWMANNVYQYRQMTGLI